MATFFKNKTNTDQNLAELFGINDQSDSGEEVDTRPGALDHPMYLSPEAINNILTDYNKE